MTYAKLDHGALVYAPRKVVYNGMTCFNPTPPMLEELGFLPVVMTEAPATEVGYHAEITGYTKGKDAIRPVWEVVADPPTPESRLTALEDELGATKIILGVE